MRQVCENVRCLWQRTRQWLNRVCEESHTCRSCQSRVGWLDKMCPTCGESNPSVVPISPGVVIAVLGSVVLLTLLCIT
jgi:hypothetical protein